MYTLHRNDYRKDGIFGELLIDGSPFMVTLEHAFLQADGTYAPIVPQGIFQCVRGVHQLSNGRPFETFEITGVEGHRGLLFHAGNFNKDSEGCVLCGQTVTTYDAAGDKMITGSREEFSKFMLCLDGVDEFELGVV